MDVPLVAAADAAVPARIETCSGHGDYCIVKTCTSAARPQRYGISFWMCAHRHPCEFEMRFESVAPLKCSAHGTIVSVHRFKKVEGAFSLSFRCKEVAEGAKWCDSVTISVSEAVNHPPPRPAQAEDDLASALSGLSIEKSPKAQPHVEHGAKVGVGADITPLPLSKDPVKPNKPADPVMLRMSESDLVSELRDANRMLDNKERLMMLPDKGLKIHLRVSALEEALAWRKLEPKATPVAALLNDLRVDNESNATKVLDIAEAPEAIAARKRSAFKNSLTYINQSAANRAILELIFDFMSALGKNEASRPTEADFRLVQQPEMLSSTLLPHQSAALSWLRWREGSNQPLRGGFLCDDMGLGKTLELISLIATDEPTTATTLIVCPASVVHQWSAEFRKHVKPSYIRVRVHHGAERIESAAEIANCQVVISTYGILSHEHQLDKVSPIFSHQWTRVVLDEGHTIKNPQTQAFKATHALRADCRWVVTGTPIQNSLKEVHSFLKFLHCEPLSDDSVWKLFLAQDKQLSAESAAMSVMRVHALFDSILLRRMKSDKNADGSALVTLPARTHVNHKVHLSTEERSKYDVFEATMRKMAARLESKATATDAVDSAPASLLVGLLRLQQLCAHPQLLSQPVESETTLEQASDVHNQEDKASEADDDLLQITSQLSQLQLVAQSEVDTPPVTSSKLRKFMKRLCSALGDPGDGRMSKAVVVSQWTKMLDVAEELRGAHITFNRIDGAVDARDRQHAADQLNTGSNVQVMLLSLRAGGVGLNLVGANHIFLLDTHWNPALELQACDRIYRVGQTRPVSVHTFICVGTIEERILALQMQKRGLASAMLQDQGSSVVPAKLTRDELLRLFRPN